LEGFVRYLEERQAEFITVVLALSWAQQPPSGAPDTWAQHLGFVRGFARYCSANDPRTEIPPNTLLPFHGHRAKPYLYTEEEILKLLQAARAQPLAYGLQGATYHALLGLLATTGMRLGEALGLTLDDVDLAEGLLTIRGAKFGKTRWVPLHATTRSVLSDYVKDRRSAFPSTSALFVTLRGNHLDAGQVHRVFYRLSRQVGLRAGGASHGPRLHDLRHRFAHLTLLRWYQEGRDVVRQLPLLSAYLGHVHLADTYWYVSASADLFGVVKSRLEDYWEQRT
jgi:integrase